VPTIVAPIHTVDQKSIANLSYFNGLHLAYLISSTEQVVDVIRGNGSIVVDLN